MGSTVGGIETYFEQLQAIKAARVRILEGTRSVLVANEKRLAEALGMKMDLRSAKEVSNPSRPPRGHRWRRQAGRNPCPR
jgi:hypothetical protein